MAMAIFLTGYIRGGNSANTKRRRNVNASFNTAPDKNTMAIVAGRLTTLRERSAAHRQALMHFYFFIFLFFNFFFFLLLSGLSKF